jgi:ribosomal protein L11 methyltransferase
VTVAYYLGLRCTLTAEAEDRLVAELWSLGTLGIETRGIDSPGLDLDSTTEPGTHQVLAYFEQPLSPAVAKRLESSADWSGAHLESVERVPAEDWLAEYRRQTRPTEIGSHFLVDSREPQEVEDSVSTDRHLLRLPARSAFGTGSHDSTQLAIELMEGLSLEGLRVLDVGTGTGILAFAALLLGAGEVIGLDIDPAAVLPAMENCSLNQLEPRLVGGTVDCIPREQRFDLVLVNVLPDRIRASLASLADLLPVGGRMIASGLLVDQHASYLQELSELGLVEKRSRRSGEWVGCLMEKAA